MALAACLLIGRSIIIVDMASARTRSTPRRRPGRPLRRPDDEGVRRRLLATAARLFAQRGSAGVGLREIARRADVTPGMISYYFGDKQGLLLAVLDDVFQRLLAGFRELAAAPPAERERPVAESFARLYIGVIGREPWIAPLILREVLAQETPLRAQFVEQFATRAAQLVQPLFAREIEAGRLRRDLDPALALLSLLGMCVFPFLAHPVTGPVLGYELDEEFRNRLAEHTARLYLDGARGPRA
jgi:AcrR family transcriptional regulator